MSDTAAASKVWHRPRKERKITVKRLLADRDNATLLDFYETSFLLRLPEELLLRIFSFLSLREMGRVQCWNRCFHKLVEKPYAVRYYAAALDKAKEIEKVYLESDKLWAERSLTFPSYALYLGLISYETLTWDCHLTKERVPLNSRLPKGGVFTLWISCGP